MHGPTAADRELNAVGARTLHNFVGKIVAPGMVLRADPYEDSPNSASWSLGSGLVQVPSKTETTSANSIYVLIRRLGILRYLPASTVDVAQHRVWVDALPRSGALCPSLCNARQPCHVSQFVVGDRVLGVVKKKTSEMCLVDIGCPSAASLSLMAFEGASKKNKPDIRLRDVVFAAISQADPDLEIELTCVDEAGKAAGMGILGRHEPGSVGNAGGMNGGVMIYCSLELVRRLPNQDTFPLLRKLSEKFPFEICVGCNGWIWLTARCPRETMLLANSIAIADYVTPEVCLQLAEELC
ncbi:unnamed protein product [Schistocephalus solidus]|uniref:Ribosomal RNA-processing protein 40 n=1 Tax=Schistocephalus solidus TaxID=70667 RepID=A0A3P7BTZ9_SCHSO|nr:unnamed protein product [Schistocephalus solidus]